MTIEKHDVKNSQDYKCSIFFIVAEERIHAIARNNKASRIEVIFAFREALLLHCHYSDTIIVDYSP